jgi:hypothetical protein
VTVLTFSAVALGMLASFGAPPSGRPYDAMPGSSQVGTAAPSPGPGEHAIRLRLSTLVDHFDLFAGQLVQLPPSRVSRILSPTLAELRDAREHGPFSFQHWSEDRVLVRLPPGAKVSRGDEIVLAGRVRTVGGARLTGELAGAQEDDLEDRGNDLLLVATILETVDGVSLAGRK